MNSKLRLFPAILVPLATLAACSGAKFSGSTPGKTTPQPELSIACAATPENVAIGASVTIAVTSTANEAQLFQTVTSGSGAKTQAQLALSGAAYAVNGGGQNQMQATEAGTYIVQIRRDATQAAADAECRWTVQTATTPPTRCEPKQRSVGAHLAFMIDNSNSNSDTDCPARRRVGRFRDSDVYRCGGATNRETAVLAAFDTLMNVAQSEPNQTNATSTLAISSFPTRDDHTSGWAKQIDRVPVAAAERDAVRNALLFTREPFGMTPYGAGLAGADALFHGLADDGKARVAVLVTDGEPTDRDPAGVEATAAALRQRGIDVITVFYTGAGGRTTRESSHINNLRRIDASSRAQGQGPWYAASVPDFDSYIRALLGGSGTRSLAERISSKVVEVQDVAALSQTFQAIIRTAVQCE